MKKLAACVLLLAAAVVLMAPAAEAEPRKLKIQNGAAAPSLDTMRLDVAKHLGYFAEEELDVEIRYGRGAALAAQLAANDQVDAAVITYEPVILGYGKGVDGKFFYQTTSRLIYYIAALEEKAPSTPAGFSGKKIGVASLGSAAVTIAKSIVRRAGADPATVTFLPVGFGQQAAEALTADRVDALALWDGGYAGLVSSGLKLRFFRHPELDDDGNAGLFASDRTLKARADDLQRLARAFTKATTFINENPEAAIRIFWKENPGSKKSGADAMDRARVELDFIAPTLKPGPKGYGHIDGGRFQAYVDTFRNEGEISSSPPLEKMLTNDLLGLSDAVDDKAVRAAARNWKAE